MGAASLPVGHKEWLAYWHACKKAAEMDVRCLAVANFPAHATRKYVREMEGNIAATEEYGDTWMLWLESNGGTIR